jgi:hypothetical protein
MKHFILVFLRLKEGENVYRSSSFRCELHNHRSVFHSVAANNGYVWLNGIHSQAYGRGKEDNGS